MSTSNDSNDSNDSKLIEKRNELIKKYIPPRYANMVFTLNITHH
jgi:hypothetical protein